MSYENECIRESTGEHLPMPFDPFGDSCDETLEAQREIVSNETGDGLEAYLLKRRPYCARCVTLNKATQALQGETYCDHHAERERHEITFRDKQRELSATESCCQWFDQQGENI